MFGVCSWAAGWRLPARLLKDTIWPSRLIVGERLRPFRVGSEPANSTEQRTVRLVPISRTNTSGTPLVSRPPSWLKTTRLLAVDAKAMTDPSAEMQAFVLSPFPLFEGPEPGAAPETMLTRVVGKPPPTFSQSRT